MQTFLPYADLAASCVVLDDRRLGKQRVETFQILRALTWPTYAWKSHPAVAMWRGFVPALVAYGLASCHEWTRRGYADSVAPQLLAWSDGVAPAGYDLPPWFGLQALHLSHRSALLRKDPAHYAPLFPDVPDDLPYHWPAPAFPRWPVRRRAAPVDLPAALRLLGYDEPRPGQAEAVAAVRDGHDALVAMPRGAGSSTAGLLAGLCTPGTTLWVSPADGPLDGPVPRLDPPPARTVASGPAAAALARPPGPADLLAMREEAAAPEWQFARPGDPVRPGAGLVVLDAAARVGRWSRPVQVPVLALVQRADAAQRAALTERLGLHDPVVAGGGWDPAGSWLAAAPVTAASRAAAVAAAVRARGPGLVVVASRDRVDALAGRLVTHGLRAAGWAPAMRPARATAAVGAWRSRRLDALVVPAQSLPPLGRRPPALLVAADAPPDLDAWRDLVAAVSPAAAVLLAGPEATAEVTSYVVSGECRRRALVERYGEPVQVPCGGCEVCDS